MIEEIVTQSSILHKHKAQGGDEHTTLLSEWSSQTSLDHISLQSYTKHTHTPTLVIVKDAFSAKLRQEQARIHQNLQRELNRRERRVVHCQEKVREHSRTRKYQLHPDLLV